MKSTVEQLSPTRVRINVEVPFTELEPDFDRAYKELAQQVRLPGFRPGKAPAQAARGPHRPQAQCSSRSSTTRCPAATARPSPTSEVQPLGQPEIEVTKIEDGEELVFTAEVDVRPEITLPDLERAEDHGRPDRGHRRGRRRRAAVAARPVRHPDRGRARRRRTATSSRSTCRPPSTARTCPSADDRGPVPRGRLRPADRRASTTRSSACQGGRDQGVHHHAGRRRARRARGRRSPSPSSRSRNASCPSPTTNSPNWQANSTPSTSCKANLARPGRAGSSASSRPSRSATRRSRRCSSRSRCRCRRRSCRPRSTTPCTTRSTASTTTRTQLRRGARRSRAAAARSSTPTTAATPRRPSRPSCCWTPSPTSSTSRSARTT